MAVKHGMGTPSSSSMPLGEMEELMDNMAGLLKVKRDELSESEEKFQREIDAKVKGINDLIAAKAEKDEQLKSKRLEKAESKREISRLKRILDGKDSSTISVYVLSFFLSKTQHRETTSGTLDGPSLATLQL